MEINLLDIFSESMISEAKKCAGAREIKQRVIDPNKAEIDRKTGQENDALYLAYCMQHLLSELKK